MTHSDFNKFSPPMKMTGKAAASAIDFILTRRIPVRSSPEFGNFVRPFSSNFNAFNPKGKLFQPRIYFSSVKELGDAVHLFHEMLKMWPLPSVIDFTKLLSSVVRMKRYSVALCMLDEMRQRRAPVNEFTYTIGINCYCLVKRVDFGFCMMGILLKSGYEPNVATFSTLTKGLFLDGKVADAKKLFKKLLDLRICEPDDVMILTVIDGLCKSGHLITARDLLRRIEMSRWRPKINVMAYNTLIDGLCKVGMVDEAFHVLREMIEKGILPNVVSYSSLIQGLCDDGRVKDVTDLVNEMANSNIPRDVITFNILIDAFANFMINLQEFPPIINALFTKFKSFSICLYYYIHHKKYSNSLYTIPLSNAKDRREITRFIHHIFCLKKFNAESHPTESMAESQKST